MNLGWVDTRARSTSHRLWSSTTFVILFFSTTDLPPPPVSPNPSICVGVATVKLSIQYQYVKGIVGSLLEGLSEAERAQVQPITFIANTDPTVHPIYHEPWFRALSDKVLTYDIP